MRRGICKHFNGVQNDCCRAGVNYLKLAGRVDGMSLVLPCHAKDFIPNAAKWRKELNLARVECDEREEPSRKDLAEHRKTVNEHVARFMKTLPLIASMKKRYKGKSAAETVECPVCKGELRMSIASVNGHVWGKCETKDCLAWMDR